MNDEIDRITCAYCGMDVNMNDCWPHIDGDSNLGVRKIDYFCSENHKYKFLSS